MEDVTSICTIPCARKKHTHTHITTWNSAARLPDTTHIQETQGEAKRCACYNTCRLQRHTIESYFIASPFKLFCTPALQASLYYCMSIHLLHISTSYYMYNMHNSFSSLTTKLVSSFCSFQTTPKKPPVTRPVFRAPCQTIR